MEIEEAFDITIPEQAPNPVYKSVFTRQPFRLADLAELVYLQQGTGKPERGAGTRRGWGPRPSLASRSPSSMGDGSVTPMTWGSLNR